MANAFTTGVLQDDNITFDRRPKWGVWDLSSDASGDLTLCTIRPGTIFLDAKCWVITAPGTAGNHKVEIIRSDGSTDESLFTMVAVDGIGTAGAEALVPTAASQVPLAAGDAKNLLQATFTLASGTPSPAARVRISLLAYREAGSY